MPLSSSTLKRRLPEVGDVSARPVANSDTSVRAEDGVAAGGFWDAARFADLLGATARFAKLDGDVRDSVLPMLTVEQIERLTDGVEASLRSSDYEAAIDGLIDGSVHYSHTGYLNQQLNFPLAGSAIGALWCAILNQGQAVFGMSPMTSMIEKRMLDWAKARLCLSPDSFGLSTGGGSLANLTALLAARNKLDGWKAWGEGAQGGLTVIVSKQAHYSIARAASIVGIGEANVRAIEADASGVMDLDRVADVLSEGGPCIVCLTLGTTSSGAFDDVEGFFARHPELDRSRVWVHVDAAHGGAFYACEKLHRQFQALALADSVCWDLHKVYFQAVPLSFLFFRDRVAADFISKHSTPYLTQHLDGAYPDMHNWTLECSRAGNAMKLWVSLHTGGEAAIVDSIRHLVELTDEIYDRLAAIEHLELFAKPTTNILCFKVKAADEDESRNLTDALLARVSDDGVWSVGHVHLDGKFFIKLCCMNPRMRREHVHQFSIEIERQVKALTAVHLVNQAPGQTPWEQSEAVW